MSARNGFVLRALFCLALLVSSASWAQDTYPSRPLRLIVSYPPGGVADLVARTLAGYMQESLGQPVVIDNRPGGATIIATEAAAKAAPDGHTIYLATDGPFVINPFIYEKLPYDPIADFIPISMVAEAPLALVTTPGLNVNNVAEFVARAKSSAKPFNYASIGTGSSQHLAMEQLRTAAGVAMTHVPYKGGALALNDVLSGQVEAMFVALSTALPHVRVGKLKVLAVGTAKRSILAPEVPTVAESGFPGFGADAVDGHRRAERNPAGRCDAAGEGGPACGPQSRFCRESAGDGQHPGSRKRGGPEGPDPIATAAIWPIDPTLRLRPE